MRALFCSAAMATTIALAACSAPSGPTFDKAAQEEIRTIVQDLTTAYNAKNPEQVMSLFSGAAVLMPPNAPTTRGTESITGYFEQRFAEGAGDLRLDVNDISGEGPLGYVSGDFGLTVRPPAGGPERRDRGKFLWIVRDHGEHWLLEYVMFSSDLPPVAPEPPAAEKPAAPAKK